MKADAIVVDTNVLISAALSPNSTPARLVALILDNYRLVFSEQTFAELESRLWRAKFDRYLPQETRRQLLHDFAAVSDWFAIGADRASYCRDSDDDKFIHLAQAARAHWLISGDKDLLDLSAVDDLRILSPADALGLFDG